MQNAREKLAGAKNALDNNPLYDAAVANVPGDQVERARSEPAAVNPNYDSGTMSRVEAGKQVTSTAGRGRSSSCRT